MSNTHLKKSKRTELDSTKLVQINFKSYYLPSGMGIFFKLARVTQCL